jgi:dTDP-4-dehydrorhamnose 3,5-epimerase
MKLLHTEIQGLAIVELDSFSDHRGAFSRLYCEHELAVVIGDRHIAQINQSRTSAVGSVRGLHYQHPPHAEMKLVRCLKGRVWDVTVDLRAGSFTFLHWHAEELSPDNARMLVIPEGFAHGFQVLEADSEMLYLHTAPYIQTAEGGLLYNDPRLGITWPLPVRDLSDRDRRQLPITPDFRGIAA